MTRGTASSKIPNTMTKNKKKETSETPAADRKPSRPSMASMVETSLKVLNERKGVPFPTLKKYLVGNFMVDMDRSLPRLKKYIRNAVEKGYVVQTAGSGVNGRFKLAKISSKSQASPVVISPIKTKNKKAEQIKKIIKQEKKIKEADKKMKAEMKIEEEAKKTTSKKRKNAEIKETKETTKSHKKVVSAKLKKVTKKVKRTT